MLEIRPELGFPQQIVAPPGTNINIGLHEDGEMYEVEVPTVVFVLAAWINGGYPIDFIDVDGQLKKGPYYIHQPPPENLNNHHSPLMTNPNKI